MTFIYPAVLTKHEDGTVDGFFPDLEMCEFSGDSMHDALEEARLAEYNWISLELQGDDALMPMVSDIDEIRVSENQEVRNVMVHFRYTEGWEE